uniref:GOLD domain-containing protein n=2 Tax=Sarcophilus harrisii TaxID=9305 RepID=G3VDV7_SARHA
MPSFKAFPSLSPIAPTRPCSLPCRDFSARSLRTNFFCPFHVSDFPLGLGGVAKARLRHRRGYGRSLFPSPSLSMAVKVWVDILVLPILLAVLFPLHACAFYIQVGAHGEECFFEQGTKGAKMVLNFRVMQGGFLEIDVDITGPNNDPLFQWVRETSGRYAFTTHQEGSYRFCFSNRASTLVPETVLFSIDKDQDPRTHLFQDEDRLHVKLEKMIKKLTAAIMVVKQKQEHMENTSGHHDLTWTRPRKRTLK